MFKYQIPNVDARIIEPENDLDRLLLLAKFPQFYAKQLNAQWFRDQITINFSVHGRNAPLQTKGIFLVLQSGTFNISEIIGTADDSCMFILCSSNILTHRFIVLFSDLESAHNFYTTVEPHLEVQLHCPTDWLTRELSNKVTSTLL